MKRLFFYFCIFEFLFSIFAFPASAAVQTLRVSPVIINVPLSPGKSYTYEITVENLTEHALPLQTSLNDFQTTGEEGGYVFEDTKTNPLLSWISLSDTVLILNPKERKKITLTINTPRNIPLGGYYGMLFFQPVLPDAAPGATRVVSKIGILLLANIGVPDQNVKQADILTFTTGLFHQDNRIPLLLRVKNTSLHFFTAKPILTISPLIPLISHPHQPMYLENKIIFQDKVRRWEQTITLPGAIPNIYKAHMAVSTGGGNYVTQDRYFIVFPFTYTIIVLAILLLLFFLVKKRNRLRIVIKILMTDIAIAF